MAGFAGTDDFILRGFGLASRISRGRADYAFDVLEDSLNTPETSSRHHRSLLTCRLGSVDDRTWNGNRGSISAVQAPVPAINIKNDKKA